jgi:hypothetical protein
MGFSNQFISILFHNQVKTDVVVLPVALVDFDFKFVF